jgi:aquaporin Z
MLAVLAEFFATFVFVTVILYATDKPANWGIATPLMVATGLMAGIIIANSASGAHLNPAVSVVMYLKGALPFTGLGSYVSAQVAGAVGAYVLKMYMDAAL